MTDIQLDFEDFVRSVIDAIEAAGLEYLIGGAVALNAWANHGQRVILMS